MKYLHVFQPHVLLYLETQITLPETRMRGHKVNTAIFYRLWLLLLTERMQWTAPTFVRVTTANLFTSHYQHLCLHFIPNVLQV
jgi:hypothetical protein